MKTEEEIRKHIQELEKLFFSDIYEVDTKKAILIEIQTLKSVLEDTECTQ